MVFKNASNTVFHWKKFLELIGLSESIFWGFITPDFDISISETQGYLGEANTAIYFKYRLPFRSRTLLCAGGQGQRCTPRDYKGNHLEDTLEEAPDSVDNDNELLEALEEEGNSNTTLIALSLKHNYIYHK